MEGRSETFIATLNGTGRGTRPAFQIGLHVSSSATTSLPT